jgi:hypothetical protein
MTRKEALAAIKKGWEKVEYTSDRWYDVSPIGVWKHRKHPKCACAIGAAAYALKMGLVEIQEALWDDEVDYVEIMKISDNAGSKEAAIAALEAWAA